MGIMDIIVEELNKKEGLEGEFKRLHSKPYELKEDRFGTHIRSNKKEGIKMTKANLNSIKATIRKNIKANSEVTESNIRMEGLAVVKETDLIRTLSVNVETNIGNFNFVFNEFKGVRKVPKLVSVETTTLNEMPEEIEVELRAFTGMLIGKFTAVYNSSAHSYTVETKRSGVLEFDAKTFIQADAKNPKFANKIAPIK